MIMQPEYLLILIQSFLNEHYTLISLYLDDLCIDRIKLWIDIVNENWNTDITYLSTG